MDERWFLRIYEWMTSGVRITAWTRFVARYTPAVMLLCIAAGSICAWCLGQAPVAWRMGAAAVASAVFVRVMQSFVRRFLPRTRPFIRYRLTPILGHEADSSFPSHHAAGAFALAVAAARYWPLVGAVLFAMAIGLSLSRVGAGLHYPTDVLAGALLGAGSGWLISGLLGQ